MLLSHAALAQFEPPEQAPTQDVNSALGALSILPPEYHNFVVKVSADNGTPDPPQWYILAYRGNPDEGLFSIMVANGEIVQEKPTFNVGELFKIPNPIAIERITIDSRSAFEIASQFAAANDQTLEVSATSCSKPERTPLRSGNYGAMIVGAVILGISKSLPPMGL